MAEEATVFGCRNTREKESQVVLVRHRYLQVLHQALLQTEIVIVQDVKEQGERSLRKQHWVHNQQNKRVLEVL